METERRRIADRRTKPVDYRRRKFDRRSRTFIYDREIYLSDTNAYGNVYFANFFHFIGEAREDLFQWVLGPNLPEVMQSGIVMVTVNTQMEYREPIYPFDLVQVKIRVPKMSRLKCYVEFEIVNKRNKRVHAIAKMLLGAVLNNKPVPLPKHFYNPMKEQFKV